MPPEFVSNLVRAALLECCPPTFVARTIREPWLHDVLKLACDDLQAFSEKDPAADKDPHCIVHGYSSFRAVMHYRLANALATWPAALEIAQARDLEIHARLISCRGKLLSGAEIHHRCTIGRRFILDHGYGTVIGETAQIGDDCYILGGVTLGAVGISDNPRGKRHPTIGNRVQIGAFTRIFGHITIGDDVFIGPQCVIKDDIPNGAVVTVKTEVQVVRDVLREKVAHVIP